MGGTPATGAGAGLGSGSSVFTAKWFSVVIVGEVANRTVIDDAKYGRESYRPGK